MSQWQKHSSAAETSALTSKSTDQRTAPSRLRAWSLVAVSLYVLSGVSQPLLVSIAKTRGLADSKCQLYMFFYYCGPASVGLSVLTSERPPVHMILKAIGIACFDLLAQTINYTGSTLSGPTIFAIIYSSVTVWTAIFSRLLLQRQMNAQQWSGVFIVFGGLSITAWDAVSLGPSTMLGAAMVVGGSAMHAMTYVMNEAILTRHHEKLSVQMNCAIQGIAACMLLLVWQVVFTRKHYDELIRQPMAQANTTWQTASLILVGLALANLVHAMSYFYTLKHVEGGATSAGVLKGLQAVLVFAVSSFLFCGLVGGEEMCFSTCKFASLIIVVIGVVLFGNATEQKRKREPVSRHSEEYSGYEVI